jgi:hypothetical protein
MRAGIDMNTRRIVLATGLGLFMLSGATRVRAAPSGEVESTAYGGESTGGWICGPAGTVKYGGAAANVRVAQREATAPPGRGFSALVGGAAEAQALTVASCSSAECERRPTAPDRLMLGTHGRVGWDNRYFGLDLGAGLYQAYRDESSHSPTIAAYPELELRGGRGGDFAVWGVAGVGSPLVTTIERPGVYSGVSLTLPSALGVDFRAGVYRRGPAILDSVGLRGDLVGRIPLTERIQLRLGAALAEPSVTDRIDGEGSIGLAAQL